jgi:hypothetical protein
MTTKPDSDTRAADRKEAKKSAGPDRPPTADEERRADDLVLDDSVVEHEEEMIERGAKQRGEGRID